MSEIVPGHNEAKPIETPVALGYEDTQAKAGEEEGPPEALPTKEEIEAAAKEIRTVLDDPEALGVPRGSRGYQSRASIDGSILQQRLETDHSHPAYILVSRDVRPGDDGTQEDLLFTAQCATSVGGHLSIKFGLTTRWEAGYADRVKGGSSGMDQPRTSLEMAMLSFRLAVDDLKSKHQARQASD